MTQTLKRTGWKEDVDWKGRGSSARSSFVLHWTAAGGILPDKRVLLPALSILDTASCQSHPQMSMMYLCNAHSTYSLCYLIMAMSTWLPRKSKREAQERPDGLPVVMCLACLGSELSAFWLIWTCLFLPCSPLWVHTHTVKPPAPELLTKTMSANSQVSPWIQSLHGVYKPGNIMLYVISTQDLSIF